MNSPRSSSDPFTLDTTSWSFLHWLFVRKSGEGEPEPKILIAVILSLLLTYVPMLLLGVAGEQPMTSLSPGINLPFLWDINVMFMFLVCLPVILRLAITDDSVLRSALAQVQSEGVLAVKLAAQKDLRTQWEKSFLHLNLGATAVALLVGGIVAYSNYTLTTGPGLGVWGATADAQLRPIGGVFLFGAGLFFALVSFYAARSLGMVLFLRKLMQVSELRLLPGHPDRSGGLRPVGALGLRNQYALTVLGVNLLLLVFVTVAFLGGDVEMWYLVAAGAVAYGVVGPAAFLLPLLPFRAGMKARKGELQSEVATRLNQRLLDLLGGKEIDEKEVGKLESLRKVGDIIEELPVWPFDAETLRRFLSAYIVPLLGAAASPFMLAVIQKAMAALGLTPGG